MYPQSNESLIVSDTSDNLLSHQQKMVCVNSVVPGIPEDGLYIADSYLTGKLTLSPHCVVSGVDERVMSGEKETLQTDMVLQQLRVRLDTHLYPITVLFGGKDKLQVKYKPRCQTQSH